MATIKLTIRESRKNKLGEVPIYLRLTHKRKTTELSLGKYIKPDHWDKNKEQVNRKYHNPSQLNAYLRSEKREIEEIIDNKLALGENFNVKDIIKIRNGIEEVKESGEIQVVQYIDNFIKNNPENLGFNTLRTYKSTLSRFKQFNSHISLNELSEDVLEQFEKYLKTKHKSSVNTIHARMKVLRKLCNLALKKEIINHYPFKNYKLKLAKTKRAFLTLNEVNQIRAVRISSKSEKLVRDTFIFSCYTGLRFSDVCTIKKSDIIVVNPDIPKFKINFQTQKTSETISFLIPSVATSILLQWGFTKKKRNEYLFPILNGYRIIDPNTLKQSISSRNAYFNKIIKQLVEQTDIEKSVSTHVARHSFSVIGLEKGIRMEVLSKLLGHSDLKTTQIYAKIVDSLKDEAMELWN